ncbi:hypothetical protein [Streptomyces filamentosus]|uniref:hypothetical protein n=1 Tax=Streptomyces filamentosus TaxID=67294 RepID=UPI0037D06FF5
METTSEAPAETELQRLVRAGAEWRYGRAMEIHALEAGPERDAEVESWSRVIGGGWEDIVRMATCSCRSCATYRAGAQARLGGGAVQQS